MAFRRKKYQQESNSVFATDGTAAEEMRLPKLAMAWRSLGIDAVIAPFAGFVVGGITSSPTRGCIGAGVWMVVAFGPTYHRYRRYKLEAAFGFPKRFKPPLWLRHRGVTWSIKVSHRQHRQVELPLHLATSWAAIGFLFPTKHSFEFIPERMNQAVQTSALPRSIPFDQIKAIEPIVPSTSVMPGGMKPTYPNVRITLKDGTIEWFEAFDFIARETCSLLESFLSSND